MDMDDKKKFVVSRAVKVLTLFTVLILVSTVTDVTASDNHMVYLRVIRFDSCKGEPDLPADTNTQNATAWCEETGTWVYDEDSVVINPPKLPLTPLLIYGWVYRNGAPVNNPKVNITNLNTSKKWQAETHADYNYYQLVGASGININASEILRFEVASPDGSHAKVFNHTVNETEIINGGIFSFNITLESSAKRDLYIR
jgi:hypothetical protein